MFEKIDVNKDDVFSKCIIFHYWDFLNINFRFLLEVCNDYHDLIQKVMSFADVVIVFVKVKEYRIHFFFLHMSKDEYTTLLRNADWTEKN